MLSNRHWVYRYRVRNRRVLFLRVLRAIDKPTFDLRKYRDTADYSRIRLFLPSHIVHAIESSFVPNPLEFRIKVEELAKRYLKEN